MDAPLREAQQARRGIETVRRRLLNPTLDSVVGCAAPLADAIGCLERLQRGLVEQPDASPGLRDEIRELRRELSDTEALLRSAAAFHQGLGYLLMGPPETPSIDYSPLGKTNAVTPIRRLIGHG